MTVKINKPALNLREELNELNKPSGITGESLLRADTDADARATLGIDNFEQVSVSTDGVISADGLTSSGNLLVGKTSPSSATVGFQAGQDGFIAATRASAQPLVLNRTTNDGIIADFRKNGTTVGSIGTFAGDLTIGDDDVGIRFDTGLGLVPWDLGANATGGASTDGAIDIGVASARFKDLHLSGQAYASYLRPTAGSTDFINFSSGAIRLATGGSESARIDTSGNLLVGTTTANQVGITLRGDSDYIYVARNEGVTSYFDRKSTDGAITEFRKDGAAVGSIGSVSGDVYIGSGDTGIRFHDGTDSIFPVTAATGADRGSTVNLGHSTNAFKDLYLSGTAYAGVLNLKDGNTNGQINCLTPTGGKLYTNTYAEQISQIQGSEKMRLDASGNLLVGTTSGSRKLEVHADNVPPMRVRRNTSDGNLVEYYKDGTTVGSIGVDYSDNLYITGNSSHAGFMFANDEVYPYRDGNYRDATLSLGAPSGRWKDLYLSGGVYLGGTGAANKLDDYERGTWTLVITGESGGSVSAGTGYYKKTGNFVYCAAYINQSMDLTSLSGLINFSLPFSGHSWHGGGSVVYANSFFSGTSQADTFIGTRTLGAQVRLVKGSSASWVSVSDIETASGSKAFMFEHSYQTS